MGLLWGGRWGCCGEEVGEGKQEAGPAYVCLYQQQIGQELMLIFDTSPGGHLFSGRVTLAAKWQHSESRSLPYRTVR